MQTSHTTQPEKDVLQKQRRPTPNPGKPEVGTGDKPGSTPVMTKDKTPDYVSQPAASGVSDPATYTDKNTQLKELVDDRLGDLEDAYARACRVDAKGNQATTLQKEIKIARDVIGSGWDNLSSGDRTQLSQWLDKTQYLTDNTPVGTKQVPYKDIPKKDQPGKTTG